MSHHDGIADEVMKKIGERFALGATGRFPEGKLDDHDEGEIRFAIGVEQGKIVIHFGKEVAWIGFNKTQAIDLAERILKKTIEL